MISSYNRKEQKSKMPNKKKSNWIKENLKAVVYAAVIALILRSLIGAPFNIPSGSMMPSLLVGDYLFASKYSYGYSRYSFPLSIFPFSGRVWASEPKRGEVLIFRRPQDMTQSYIRRAWTSEDYIKRLIGLPGDTIQMKSGRLYINDVLVPREFKRFETHKDSLGRPIVFSVYDERLPNGVVHEIMEQSDDALKDNTDLIVIPADYYFFMGDNRDNSQDSRYNQVGLVHKDNLIGKARFIFYSNNGTSPFFAFWNWGHSIRWDRLFQEI